MIDDQRTIETNEIEWDGIRIEIKYEPDWLNMSGRYPIEATAHIEIRTIAPARFPLPMTETGYRSHFTCREIVEQEGGPVAFVLGWLDLCASEPLWLKRKAKANQLELF